MHPSSSEWSPRVSSRSNTPRDDRFYTPRTLTARSNSTDEYISPRGSARISEDGDDFSTPRTQYNMTPRMPGSAPNSARGTGIPSPRVPIGSPNSHRKQSQQQQQQQLQQQQFHEQKYRQQLHAHLQAQSQGVSGYAGDVAYRQQQGQGQMDQAQRPSPQPQQQPLYHYQASPQHYQPQQPPYHEQYQQPYQQQYVSQGQDPYHSQRQYQQPPQNYQYDQQGGSPRQPHYQQQLMQGQGQYMGQEINQSHTRVAPGKQSPVVVPPSYQHNPPYSYDNQYKHYDSAQDVDMLYNQPSRDSKGGYSTDNKSLGGGSVESSGYHNLAPYHYGEMAVSDDKSAYYAPEQVPRHAISRSEAKSHAKEEQDGAVSAHDISMDSTHAPYAPSSPMRTMHNAEEQVSLYPYQSEDMDAVYAAGMTEQDVEDIFSYARHARVVDIEKLLDQGMPVNVRDAYGNTLLTIACQNGNKRVAKAVLRRAANINAKNNKGNTPLHYCFQYGYGESLGQYLIEKGADAGAINNVGKSIYDGV